MQYQTLSRYSRTIALASILALLLGGSLAFADQQKTFTTTQEFQVHDPAEPVVTINVNDTFIAKSAPIIINISSQAGVKHLSGVYSVIVEQYNDTSSQYQPYKTLATNQKITLTPTPTTLTFSFTTGTPGYYRVNLTFSPTSVETA